MKQFRSRRDFLFESCGGISGPGFPWRTMTSPLPSSGCPAYFASAGLGSNVSMWLTPPLMNSEITAFARGSKCGFFATSGLCTGEFDAHVFPTVAPSNPS